MSITELEPHRDGNSRSIAIITHANSLSERKLVHTGSEMDLATTLTALKWYPKILKLKEKDRSIEKLLDEDRDEIPIPGLTVLYENQSSAAVE